MRCSRCGGERFSRHSWCRSCQAEYERARNKANPEIQRRKSLRRYHGMSLEEYNEMGERQGWRCAICRRQRRLVVDHNHDTGERRGLLCTPCNLFLGRVESETGRASLAYLANKGGDLTKNEAAEKLRPKLDRTTYLGGGLNDARLFEKALATERLNTVERMVQRSHDGDQYRDGGNHPNSSIRKCGICSGILEDESVSRG